MGSTRTGRGLPLIDESVLKIEFWPAPRQWYGGNGDRQEKRQLFVRTVLCSASDPGAILILQIP